MLSDSTKPLQKTLLSKNNPFLSFRDNKTLPKFLILLNTLNIEKSFMDKSNKTYQKLITTYIKILTYFNFNVYTQQNIFKIHKDW